MSRVLTLELPDEVYGPIEQAARQSGQTPEEWAIARLRASAPSDQERASAVARLMRHAGAVNVPDATGADNETLDRDLAREYESRHEDP